MKPAEGKRFKKLYKRHLRLLKLQGKSQKTDRPGVGLQGHIYSPSILMPLLWGECVTVLTGTNQLCEADTHQKNNQHPKKNKTAKRKRQISEQHPCRQHQTATQIDGDRSPKAKSDASAMLVVSFDQQCDTDSKEHPAKYIGVESRHRIRDPESGDKHLWKSDQQSSQGEIDNSVNY